MSKFLTILVFLFSTSLYAQDADNSDIQFEEDGTTREIVQQALSGYLTGSDLQIIEYGKHWNAYNPMSKVLGRNHICRVMTF